MYLVKVIQLYSQAGFVVQTTLMDLEVNKVISELKGMVVNTNAAKEHIAEMPNIVTINLIHFCVFWFNMMPIKAGYSDKYSPR